MPLVDPLSLNTDQEHEITYVEVAIRFRLIKLKYSSMAKAKKWIFSDLKRHSLTNPQKNILATQMQNLIKRLADDQREIL